MAERFQDAMSAFETFTRKYPEHAEARYELGMIYEILGRSSEACASFRRYLELAPKGPRAPDAKGSLAACR